jgi:hypothetical protein
MQYQIPEESSSDDLLLFYPHYTILYPVSIDGFKGQSYPETIDFPMMFRNDHFPSFSKLFPCNICLSSAEGRGSELKVMSGNLAMTAGCRWFGAWNP